MSERSRTPFPGEEPIDKVFDDLFMSAINVGGGAIRISKYDKHIRNGASEEDAIEIAKRPAQINPSSSASEVQLPGLHAG